MDNGESSDTLELAFELSQILDCGLDKKSLSICMGLLELGVHPEVLADVVKRLRKEIRRGKESQAE